MPREAWGGVMVCLDRVGVFKTDDTFGVTNRFSVKYHVNRVSATAISTLSFTVTALRHSGGRTQCVYQSRLPLKCSVYYTFRLSRYLLWYDRSSILATGLMLGSLGSLITTGTTPQGRRSVTEEPRLIAERRACHSKCYRATAI